MSSAKPATRKGATMLEFTLVGIGLIFVLISCFEVARGLWTYQTLSYAVREGTRYAAVHGKGCATASCQITISQIASMVKASGVGLDPYNTTLTLTPYSGSATSDTIANLMTQPQYTSTNWPPASANSAGQTVQITATYPFRTFLAAFWVGSRPANYSGTFTLGASSNETIQF